MTSSTLTISTLIQLSCVFERFLIPQLARLMRSDIGRVSELLRSDVRISPFESGVVSVKVESDFSGQDFYLVVTDQNLALLLKEYYRADMRGQLVELGHLDPGDALFVGAAVFDAAVCTVKDQLGHASRPPLTYMYLLCRRLPAN